MDDASETLFALKPVTFRYKKRIEVAEMATVCADYLLCAAARSLEALCRSRLLERRVKRLSVASIRP
jgi:hypothetical protein